MRVLTLAEAVASNALPPTQLLALRLYSVMEHYPLDVEVFGVGDSFDAMMELLVPTRAKSMVHNTTCYNYCYCLKCGTLHMDLPVYTREITSRACSSCYQLQDWTGEKSVNYHRTVNWKSTYYNPMQVVLANLY